jgi:uncharacterized protein YbjT (DUF2867 family)
MSDVVIAGAHGQIARLLTRLLVQRGDRVRGLIRSPDHAEDLRADGSEPVLCDLEHASPQELAAAISGADAVVFAAGAGPGSGAARKLTVDRDGAIALATAATTAGVARYLMVSSVGAEDPPPGDEVFAVYQQAKAAADRALVQTGLDWTILRPGPLTDDAATGRLRLTTQPHRGDVTRADVAAVLAVLLHDPRAPGATLYVANGDDPLDTALATALGT